MNYYVKNASSSDRFEVFVDREDAQQFFIESVIENARMDRRTSFLEKSIDAIMKIQIQIKIMKIQIQIQIEENNKTSICTKKLYQEAFILASKMQYDIEDGVLFISTEGMITGFGALEFIDMVEDIFNKERLYLKETIEELRKRKRHWESKYYSLMNENSEKKEEERE